MMPKLLSCVFACLFLTSAVLLCVEKYSHAKTKTELNNAVSQYEGMIKEKDGLYSSQSVVIKDLEDSLNSLAKESNKIIQNRNEKIESITSVSLAWKDKYFAIKNATSTVIPVDPNTPTTPDCNQCFLTNRIKVEFEKELDFLSVQGFTLSNPAYAELTVRWTKPLALNLVLTRRGGRYRVYLDSNNNGVEISELKLSMDEDSFSKRWFEKILFGGDLMSSQNSVLFGFNFSYDLYTNLFIGPKVVFLFDGINNRKFYGFNIGYYPFLER